MSNTWRSASTGSALILCDQAGRLAQLQRSLHRVDIVALGRSLSTDLTHLDGWYGSGRLAALGRVVIIDASTAPRRALELLDAVRRRDANVPIVLLAHASRLRAGDLGANIVIDVTTTADEISVLVARIANRPCRG